MAFQLQSDLTEVPIYDEKSDSTQSLYARDPTPQEQLAYDRERVSHNRGKQVNRIRQTRIKYGCRVLDHPQAAATPKDVGYGFLQDGKWVPLTTETPVEPALRERVIADWTRAQGREWASWIREMPDWKIVLLARAPQHIERVASVVLEGAADYKQSMANQSGEEEEEEKEEEDGGEETLGN